MKTLMIITALLYTVNSFSQTQKETVQWIASKLEKYGNAKIKTMAGFTEQTIVYSSQDGIISLTEESSFSSGGSWGKEGYQFNLNDIISCATPFSSEMFYLKTAGNQITLTSGNKIKMVNYVNVILDWNAEENLRDRFNKALTALIKFNKDKSKHEAY